MTVISRIAAVCMMMAAVFATNAQRVVVQTNFTPDPAPMVYDDTFYLAYAAGGVPEHISYSVSDKPYGPWKYMGKIMPYQEMNSFTNHCGIADFRGKHYFVYHCGLLPGGSGFNRSTAMETFEYGDDGTIPVILPSAAGVEPVGTLDPYSRVEAETMAWSEGLKTDACDEAGVYVSEIHDGDYMQVRSVDFGTGGASAFTVSVASGLRGGEMTVYADDDLSHPIVTVNVPDTGGWEKWQTITVPVSAAVTGVHDLTITFSGRKSCKLFNFDHWQFKK